MSGNGEILNREFLAERDYRILKMKQSGLSTQEIARRLNMTLEATNNAIKRQLGKLNREAMLAYPEVLRMELDRLDALQAALWPLTQHRRVTLDDGTQVDVEPDQKAVGQVLAIIGQRTKLLGMTSEAAQVQINIEQDQVAMPVLAGMEADGPAAIDAFDPETEARQLIELMGSSGVIDRATAEALLNTPKELDEGTVDAEIIEED